MDVDSLAGDVDSVAGGLSLLEPLLERVLADSVPQLHGWLRVFGKFVDRTEPVRGLRERCSNNILFLGGECGGLRTSSRRHYVKVTSQLT